MTRAQARLQEPSLSVARSALRAGFWSAVAVATFLVYPFAGLVLPLVLPPALWFGFDLVAAFFFPFTVFLLFVSISCYAPSEKKTWARIAVCFAILYVGSKYLRLITLLAFRQHLETGSPFLTMEMALTPLEFAFLGLAGLLARPVFRKTRLELSIRWCLATSGVCFAIGIQGYGLGSRTGNSLAAPGYLAMGIVFPITAALLAAFFLSEDRIRRRSNTELNQTGT